MIPRPARGDCRASKAEPQPSEKEGSTRVIVAELHPLMQQLQLRDAELAVSQQPGVERRRTSAGGDITAETNFHNDAFRKGTTPNASLSLVQEWTGFSPVEDMAVARGAPSTYVEPRCWTVACRHRRRHCHPAEASPEGHRHTDCSQQLHSCVGRHPLRSGNMQKLTYPATRVTLPHTEAVASYRRRHKHPPSTLPTSASHRQAHAPPRAPPPAPGAPDVAVALNPVPPSQQPISHSPPCAVHVAAPRRDSLP